MKNSFWLLNKKPVDSLKRRKRSSVMVAFGVKEEMGKGEQPNINMTWNSVYEYNNENKIKIVVLLLFLVVVVSG